MKKVVLGLFLGLSLGLAKDLTDIVGIEKAEKGNGSSSQNTTVYGNVFALFCRFPFYFASYSYCYFVDPYTGKAFYVLRLTGPFPNGSQLVASIPYRGVTIQIWKYKSYVGDPYCGDFDFGYAIRVVDSQGKRLNISVLEPMQFKPWGFEALYPEIKSIKWWWKRGAWSYIAVVIFSRIEKPVFTDIVFSSMDLCF